MRKVVLLISGILLMYATSYTQNTRIKDNNAIGWYNQFATIKFNKKWSGHLEYQWRRDNVIRDWQQSLLRIGVNYQLNPKVQLRAGYGWIETFAYGDIPLQAAGRRFPEHRLFQVVTLTDAVNKVGISHRFMLEQRWVGRYTQPSLPKVDDYVYTNRIRYMYRMQIPLNKNSSIIPKTPYFAAYDEVFIGFGKNVNANVFDQNRFAALVGYQFNKTLRIEGGFFNQIVQLGRLVNNRNVFQYNTGLILNVNYNLNLGK